MKAESDEETVEEAVEEKDERNGKGEAEVGRSEEGGFGFTVWTDENGCVVSFTG